MSPESPPTWNTDDNKLIVTHNFFLKAVFSLKHTQQQKINNGLNYFTFCGYRTMAVKFHQPDELET
ncbi:hypothetical protein OUZ56_006428 [Daphnia magna]|uniref:Uncharacterized protein n=1 Tax=Daphnia magna TaxID=35525 RepID=A0ABQ9YVM9_9CRUS|nr:hypothetical protein OUZ56_006428 [Daphnia magna]